MTPLSLNCSILLIPYNDSFKRDNFIRLIQKTDCFVETTSTSSNQVTEHDIGILSFIKALGMRYITIKVSVQCVFLIY